MKPVSRFYKKVDGWDELPNELFPFLKPGEGKYFRSFGSKTGVQLIFDTLRKSDDGRNILHVSFAPLFSMRKDLSEGELVAEIAAKIPVILRDFFGDLKFERMPDDVSVPHVKHFFHYYENEIFSEN